MTAWQRRLPLVVSACALVGLVTLNATAGTPTTGQPSAVQPPAAQPPTSPSSDSMSDLTPRIAIAYDIGERGNAGFNELAWEGMKRAADEFDAELKEIAVTPSDTDAEREERLTELADAGYYPIFAIGSTWAGPLAKVAPKYPGAWFGLVDNGTVHEPNVIGIQFNEEQGSFLVGAAAALTSKTGNVGFVGALRDPVLEKYEAGFTAGAQAANPDIKVQVAYLTRPPDGSSVPDEARKAALGMYDAGADVIFGAGSDSGDGVIQAAHERGLWAIGADSDQYLLADPSVRGVILTSMLKRVDVGTYTIVMEVANRVPKDGNNVFGLDRDGVGYSTSGGFVDPIKSQLDTFAARIAAGEILVPRTPGTPP